MKPSNVDMRKVEGRYIMGVRDGEDPDSEPDFIAAEGTFDFLASVPYLPDPTADPSPVVIFPPYVKGVLDSEGYLCTARLDGTPGERGVWLIVTDDPDLTVSNWTWNVSYKFTMVDGVLPKIDPHSFAVPSGSEPINLVTVVKTPASPGYGLPQAEAAVLRAEGAAVSSAEDAALAAAAADRAEQVAGATDTGVALLLGDAGTETGALLEAGLAPKADIVAVDGALALKADLVGGVVPDAQTPSGVTSSLNSLSMVKADKSTVENDLAFKADATALESKADLEAGKVPVAQLPPIVSRGALTVNASDYVNADGVTDDGLLFKNLLASLPAGARVLMPDTRMLVNQIVTVPKSVTLIGGDIRATHSGPALWVRSGSVSIEDMSVEGNGTGTYDGNVSLIRANGTLAAPFRDLRFHGLKLKGSQGSGLRVEYAVGATLERVEVDGFVYMGIQFLSVTDGKIDRANIKNVNHNATIGNSYGISCSDDQNTDAARTRHVTISRSVVDGMRDWVGIETHGGYDIRVSDNTVTNCASGIAMATGAISRSFGPERVNVMGNYIEFGNANVQRGGLRLQGRAGGPQASGIMKGNTMIGYTSPTIFADYDAAKSDVTGNITA